MRRLHAAQFPFTALLLISSGHSFDFIIGNACLCLRRFQCTPGLCWVLCRRKEAPWSITTDNPVGYFCHLLLQRRKPRLREGLPQGHLARKGLDLKPGLLRKPRLLSPLPRGIPALPPPQVHSGSCWEQGYGLFRRMRRNWRASREGPAERSKPWE